MIEPKADDITTLLVGIREGRASLSVLLPLVYDDLRRQANVLLRRRRSQATLQTAALVHEAAGGLLKQSLSNWNDRVHFLAVAAQAMRQILAACARRKASKKRGGGWTRVAFAETIHPGEQEEEDLIALYEALEGLSALDERMAQIVECRFFAEMTVKEIAQALSVSISTVEGDWWTARAWLARKLGQAGVA